MTYQSPTADLGIALEAGRLTIVFDRPANGNRINYAMLEGIRSACLEAAHDSNVRVVVLRGSGTTFSEGDEWNDMGPWPARLSHRLPEGSHGPAPLPEQDAIRALRELVKPTIALIDGTALGLAMDMAAVCDLRVASDSATIGDPRIHQGRAAATGISYVLPRLIGQSQATRILLLGETLGAAEAHRIQLVHQLVPADQFDAETRAIVDRVAKLPTRSWEVHKKQVLPQLDLGFDAAMTHCLGVRQTHVIEDIAEGRLAWGERREPNFTGR